MNISKYLTKDIIVSDNVALLCSFYLYLLIHIIIYIYIVGKAWRVLLSVTSVTKIYQTYTPHNHQIYTNSSKIQQRLQKKQISVLHKKHLSAFQKLIQSALKLANFDLKLCFFLLFKHYFQNSKQHVYVQRLPPTYNIRSFSYTKN